MDRDELINLRRDLDAVTARVNAMYQMQIPTKAEDRVAADVALDLAIRERDILLEKYRRDLRS